MSVGPPMMTSATTTTKNVAATSHISPKRMMLTHQANLLRLDSASASTTRTTAPAQPKPSIGKMNTENRLFATPTHVVRLKTRRSTMRRTATFINRGMTTTGIDLGFGVDCEPDRVRAVVAARVSGTKWDEVTSQLCHVPRTQPEPHSLHSRSCLLKMAQPRQNETFPTDS